MADEETEDSPKKKSSFLKILLFVIIPMFITSGTVAGLYFAGVFGGGTEVAEGEEGEEYVESEEGEEVVGPAQYIPLDPPFVVNFANAGEARFLQITVEIMTRDPMVEEHVKTHMPAIRNNLVMLFSSQTTDSVSTLDGKEALREETLYAIQDILDAETGNPGVESVYFTSFVMQ